MAQAYTHRPSFDGPTHIPANAAVRYLWGEPQAGEVSDWVFVSSDHLHHMIFSLPPGGWFRHSETSRTYFNTDEVYYVLQGTMILCNPETGEVHPVEEGEAVFFGPDTWHHAYNYGTGTLRVLEFMAPGPRQGVTQAYARTKPYLQNYSYTQDQYLGRLPEAAEEARAKFSMKMIRPHDWLWRLEGKEKPVLTGLLASTHRLTVGGVRLLPGQKSEVQRHAGDEGLYVLQGTLHVHLPEADGQRWHELAPGDAFYLPQNTSHQYYNYTGEMTQFLFGVSPGYLPEDR